jgi:hypothetical protein
MICHDKKFLYIHIPKTAGKSMETFMTGRKWWNPHTVGLNNLEQIKEGKYQDYFKYTIVRNPFDWIVSMYHFFAQGLHRSVMARELQVLFSELGFDGFVRSFDELPKLMPKWKGLTSQHEFICDSGFNILLDHIIYYERLGEGVKLLRKRFGITGEFPHQNRSNHEDYRSYYNDDLIRIVASKFSKDIELFYPHLAPEKGKI